MITNYFSSTLKEKIDSTITIYRQNLFLIPLFRKVFEMPFDKYDDSKIQQEINSAVDASFSEWSGIEGIMKELTNFLTLFASFIIYLILIFRLSWKFAVLCIIFSSINILFSQYSIKGEDKLVEKVFGINNLMDLNKLKPLLENGIKINYSRLARELNVDRRTIKKYCFGYTKKETKNKSSKIDVYYDIIYELLYGNETTDVKKVFEYKRILLFIHITKHSLKKEVAASTTSHYHFLYSSC